MSIPGFAIHAAPVLRQAWRAPAVSPLRRTVVRSMCASPSSPAASSPARPAPAATSAEPMQQSLPPKMEKAAAEALLRTKGFRPNVDKVIVFDGVCVMCNGGVDFVLRWDTANQFKFAALQSEAGRALTVLYDAPQDLSTMVYVENGVAHTKSEAVLRIGKRLFAFAPAASLALVTVPRPMRDWFYTNVVAENRYDVFGKRDVCRLVEPGMEDRFL